MWSSFLGNDFCIAEPGPTRLYSSLCSTVDITLEWSWSNYFSIFVPLGFSISVHLQPFDGARSTWITNAFNSITATVGIQAVIGSTFFMLVKATFGLSRITAFDHTFCHFQIFYCQECQLTCSVYCFDCYC